jgi:hypothetical protein
MGSIVMSLSSRAGAPPLALAAAFALSWVGSAVTAGAEPVAVAAAVADAHRDCGGGAESPIAVAITPARSVAGAGGDALVLDVAIGNRLAGKAAARYGLELVSDVGAPIIAPVRSPKIALAKAGHHHVELVAPAGLADGYYVARVTAAAADGATAATQVSEVYLRADAGSVHQVDSDEYFARSRASVGVK